MDMTKVEKGLGRPPRSCQPCRTKRIKCDRNLPICGQCLLHRRACDSLLYIDNRGYIFRDETTTVANKAILSYDQEQRLQADYSKKPVDSEGPRIENYIVFPDAAPFRPLLTIGKGKIAETAFNRFMTRFVTVVISFRNEPFWHDLVLPAARVHDATYHAVLAIGTLYDLSLADILHPGKGMLPFTIQKRYETAVIWHCESVNKFERILSTSQIISSQQVTTILVSTILSMYVEIRQAHHLNLRFLLRAAFAVLHSARHHLDHLQDPIMLTSLAMLLELPGQSYIGTSSVLKEHWRSAIAIARKLAAEMESAEYYNLRLDLICLLYEHNDLIDHRSKDTTFQPRLQIWLKHFQLYEQHQSYIQNIHTHPPAAFMLNIFLTLQTSWQFYMEECLSNNYTLAKECLSAFERSIRIPSSNPKEPFPSFIFEHAVVPQTISMMWYWRNQTMLTRLAQILRQFDCDGLREFILATISYLEVLMRTDCLDATAMEIRLFGGRPRVLLPWHTYLCTRQLVQDDLELHVDLRGSLNK